MPSYPKTRANARKIGDVVQLRPGLISPIRELSSKFVTIIRCHEVPGCLAPLPCFTIETVVKHQTRRAIVSEDQILR